MSAHLDRHREHRRPTEQRSGAASTSSSVTNPQASMAHPPSSQGQVVGLLGIRGRGPQILANLLGGGCSVVLWDSFPFPRQAMPPGVRVKETAAAVLEETTVVIVNMQSEAETSQLISSGVLGSLRPGSFWVDLSISSPAAAAEVAKVAALRGAFAVDAPTPSVLSPQPSSKDCIFIGCDTVAMGTVKPFVEAITRASTSHAGPPGAGQLWFGLTSFLKASRSFAMSEALSVAAKFGFSPEHSLKVLDASSGTLHSEAKKVVAGREIGLLADLEAGIQTAADAANTAMVPLTQSAQLLQSIRWLKMNNANQPFPAPAADGQGYYTARMELARLSLGTAPQLGSTAATPMQPATIHLGTPAAFLVATPPMASSVFHGGLPAQAHPGQIGRNGDLGLLPVPPQGRAPPLSTDAPSTLAVELDPQSPDRELNKIAARFVAVFPSRLNTNDPMSKVVIKFSTWKRILTTCLEIFRNHKNSKKKSDLLPKSFLTSGLMESFPLLKDLPVRRTVIELLLSTKHGIISERHVPGKEPHLWLTSSILNPGLGAASTDEGITSKRTTSDEGPAAAPSLDHDPAKLYADLVPGQESLPAGWTCYFDGRPDPNGTQDQVLLDHVERIAVPLAEQETYLNKLRESTTSAFQRIIETRRKEEELRKGKLRPKKQQPPSQSTTTTGTQETVPADAPPEAIASDAAGGPIPVSPLPVPSGQATRKRGRSESSSSDDSSSYTTSSVSSSRSGSSAASWKD